jgi:hypothetical protein
MLNGWRKLQNARDALTALAEFNDV